MSTDPHDDRTPSYVIGYGKPPAVHRFQPGRSCNPKGRPRKAASFGEALGILLARSTPTLINGRRCHRTISEIVALRVVKEMMTGNLRALERLIPLLERYAPASAKATEATTIDVGHLTEEQLRVLASIPLFGGRHTA